MAGWLTFFNPVPDWLPFVAVQRFLKLLCAAQYMYNSIIDETASLNALTTFLHLNFMYFVKGLKLYRVVLEALVTSAVRDAF